MATVSIMSTGTKITFCNAVKLNRQNTEMGVMLQKYARYFKEFWPQEHPAFTFLEYCTDTCTLTLYSEDREIDHFVIPENLVVHLEAELKDILCKLIQGGLF